MSGPRAYILADFGSTYTKLVAVDALPEAPRLLGAARAPTTVREGLQLGLERGLAALEVQVRERGRPGDVDVLRSAVPLACSSAAGGLRMVAVGLTADLTAEAARRAALGAGARVLGVYAGELDEPGLGRLLADAPDIVLLAGGTDGGNQRALLHNARLLAGSPLRSAVVVAGNREASGEAAELLRRAGKRARVAPNVMPELGVLAVEGAREAIREAFLEHIARAPGYEGVRRWAGGVLMPTPAAVLEAAKLLADGVPGGEPGIGELAVIDIGGATTDVHSVATGLTEGVQYRGLPEPRVKRTVEGDLGLRVSALSLLEHVGGEELARRSGLPVEEIRRRAEQLHASPELLSTTVGERRLDQAMAEAAASVAMERHCGVLERMPTPSGFLVVQRGKDLRALPWLVGTGGVFGSAPEPEKVVRAACRLPGAGAEEAAAFQPAGRKPAGASVGSERVRLRPLSPRLLIDREYGMAAMGLLSTVAPEAALRLLKGLLVPASRG